MSSEATRPPWLYERCRLEQFVEKQNPSLNILQLRCDRNRCQLVNELLDQIVSHENIGRPSQFEMNLAKIHLAVDLQYLLQQWCGIGLTKTMEGCRGSLGLERINSAPKVEAASPPATGFPLPVNWGPRNNSCPRPRDITLQTSQTTSAVYNRPAKRSLDEDQYKNVTKMARVDKTLFVCPYYARDPNLPEHTVCASKTFPNPRKLKEHVWRWLKPFKCSNCGEGFGREKTRTIHCEQRKTKCKKAESTYEGSLEYHRDLQIESAKSTQEMIDILESYEKEAKGSSQGQDYSLIDCRRYSTESEGSSSPEAQNDSREFSLDNGSDGEMNLGEEKYVDLGSRPSTTTYQNPDSAYTRTNTVLQEETRSTIEGLSPHTQEEQSSKYGRLSPMSWQDAEPDAIPYVLHTRRKSAPSVYYPTIPTNNFDVPQITVTEPEPLLMDDLNHPTNQPVFRTQPFQYSSTTDDTSSYYSSPMGEGSDLTGGRSFINENSSHNQQMPATVIPFCSNGFRSCPPFIGRVRCK